MLKFFKSKTAKIVGGLMIAFVLMFGAGAAANAALTSAQVNAILGLLNSFGADATTVANVQASLTGSAPVVSTSSSTVDFGTKTLKKGSKGQYVKNLQAFLGIQADGVFGNQTAASVKAWQANNNLTADGYFGALSRAAANAGSGSTGSTVSTGDSTTGGDTVATTGPVTAMLSADNPASGTIVAGQATADLMHVTFTGNGVINSLTFTRGGVSDQSTLDNVYLYDGVSRLTDGYSFNTNSNMTMSNLNLAVNGSRTISVKADVASTSTDYDLYVTLASFSAGTTVNTVSIKGNDMFIAASGSLATITFSAGNTVSAASVNAGTSSYTVWRQAIQVNTRSLDFKAANFRITGSAPSDALANVGLYVDGVKAGANATNQFLNGSNYLSFDFSSAPISLTTGTHTLEVRGDIEKGSSYNFTVALQQASDLMVLDPQVGVNVAIGSFSASTAGTISIGTGSFTAVVDPSFSSATNITAAASNVTIAKFKLHGYGEDIKVTSLPITTVLTTPTPSAAGLQNVTAYFNGSQVGTQKSLAIGLNTFTLGSQMIIPAGVDSTLEIRGDLRTTAGTNYTAGNVSANLGAATAEGWTSKASITGPTATGTVLAMQSGTLGLSKNSAYLSQNANPNTAGVKIGSYVLQNQSTSESIRVTSMDVKLTYGSATSSSNLSGLRTSETTGNASIPVQPATALASASATNTFAADFILAPGQVRTIDVFADSSSDAGSNNTVLSALTITSLGVTSNVSATSSLTTGQTITFMTGTLADPTVVTSNSDVAQLVAAANGGNADGSHFVYNFTSADAPATVTELTFSVTSTTAVAVKVGTVSAPVIGTTAYLTGLNLVVPNAGSGLNVDVYVSYPEIGVNGIASYTASTLTLTTIKSVSGNITSTASSLTVAAPTMTLVGSKPTFAVIDSSDTLSNSQIKIAEVTVSADAKGDIRLGQLPISVTSTGVAAITTSANNLVVKDTSDTVVATINSGLAVSAAGTGTDAIVFGATKATATATTAFTPILTISGGTGYATAPTVTFTGLTCSTGVVTQPTGTAIISTGGVVTGVTIVAGSCTLSGTATGTVAVAFTNPTGTSTTSYLIPAGTSKTFRVYATPSSVAGAVNTTSLSTKLGVVANVEWYDVAGNSTTARDAAKVFNYPTTTSVITN